jgi:hypothetical protein
MLLVDSRKAIRCLLAFTIKFIFMNYKALLIATFIVNQCAICQSVVDIKLAVVQRQHSKDSITDLGILMDVKNTTDSNIALYTASKDLVRCIKFYKYSTSLNKYEEIIHPDILLLNKEKALKDSIFRSSQYTVDFFGPNDYNSQSVLYRQFTENDSLWYDHLLRKSQLAENVTLEEINRFKEFFAINSTIVKFEMVENKEHFQDFLNISFLNLSKSDYKIELELPDIDIRNHFFIAKNFLLIDKNKVRSNTIYISIR